MKHRHPANVAHHDEAGLGDRLADRVSALVGSWRFIIVQSVIVAAWIAANAIVLAHGFDPYPFILLNLAFSTQAAYAAPILQLAQNRQTEHDRLRAEHDYEVNEQALAGVLQLRALALALAQQAGVSQDTVAAAMDHIQAADQMMRENAA